MWSNFKSAAHPNPKRPNRDNIFVEPCGPRKIYAHLRIQLRVLRDEI